MAQFAVAMTQSGPGAAGCGGGCDRHQLSMPNCVSTQRSLTLAKDETAGRGAERLTYKTHTFKRKGKKKEANARGWDDCEDQR